MSASDNDSELTPGDGGDSPDPNGETERRQEATPSDGDPGQAFDALPHPEPESAYAEWPYTDRRPAAPEPNDEVEEAEPGREDMGFFDHLEELRSRIIKALLGVVAGAIIGAIYIDYIMNTILLGPATRSGVKLINTEPMGQLTLTLQVALICGLIISIPWIIWQFWQFIKPGLYPQERKYTSLIALLTILCFLSGVAFAYFVMIPTSLGFASQFGYGPIENMWSISSYFSFVLGFILACGVVFEMPMLSFALGRFGVLTPGLLRRYRRHAAVALLIVAAIITPTPDPINQLMLAVPLYGLFEVSIVVAAAAARKREEAYAEMFSDDDIENIADKQ